MNTTGKESGTPPVIGQRLAGDPQHYPHCRLVGDSYQHLHEELVFSFFQLVNDLRYLKVLLPLSTLTHPSLLCQLSSYFIIIFASLSCRSIVWMFHLKTISELNVSNSVQFNSRQNKVLLSYIKCLFKFLLTTLTWISSPDFTTPPGLHNTHLPDSY